MDRVKSGTNINVNSEREVAPLIVDPFVYEGILSDSKLFRIEDRDSKLDFGSFKLSNRRRLARKTARLWE